MKRYNFSNAKLEFSYSREKLELHWTVVILQHAEIWQ
jgi:hypothetical protein